MSCLTSGRWWAWDRGGLSVRVACGAPADRGALTRAERSYLAGRALTPARRDAWIRGRALAREALGLRRSVLATPAGEPRVAGGGWWIGFSHDGAWTAIVARRGGSSRRVAVDVVACDRARAARALARIDLRGAPGLDPRAAWSALECAVKLRRRHVASLLDHRVDLVVAPDGALVVAGVGPPLVARIARLSNATVAWTEDPC